MFPKLRPLVVRYGVAVVSIGLTTPLSLLLAPWEEAPFAPYLAAVMISAWYGGLGPGLFATGLAAATLSYFFLPPLYSLLNDDQSNLRLGLFMFAGVVIVLLNELKARLETYLRQQNRMKQECMAVLAHELRTPLSTILHAVATMRLCRPQDHAMLEASRLIERQARKLAQLTNDLLDLTRVELGKVRLCKELLDVRGAILQAIETTRPLIDNANHQLEVSLPNEPLWLEADPVRFEQIMVNLLGNAAKYTPPGGQIWVSAERGDGMVRVGVRDNGIGIDPKVLPRVFDLFVQAEEGARGGLGIGLSLVRRLVELHGGSLMARSEGLGKGSEFILTLPVHQERSQLQQESTIGVA
jgi:signal transduction histidine kinase